MLAAILGGRDVAAGGSAAAISDLRPCRFGGVFSGVATFGPALCPTWLPRGSKLLSVSAGPFTAPSAYEIRIAFGGSREADFERTAAAPKGRFAGFVAVNAGRARAVTAQTKGRTTLSLVWPDRVDRGYFFVVTLSSATGAPGSERLVLTRIVDSLRAPSLFSRVRCLYAGLAGAIAAVVGARHALCARWLPETVLPQFFTANPSAVSLSPPGFAAMPHIVLEWVVHVPPPGRQVATAKDAQRDVKIYYNAADGAPPALNSDHYVAVLRNAGGPQIDFWVTLHSWYGGRSSDPAKANIKVLMRIVRSLRPLAIPRSALR
jgi:hypothetical protein